MQEIPYAARAARGATLGAALPGCRPWRLPLPAPVRSPMPFVSRSPAPWALALLCAAALAGCDKERSKPTAPPPRTRAVAATVEDTTGARLASTQVIATRQDQVEADFQTTDASGVAHFALHDGRWCLSTNTGAFTPVVLVAGSTGNVAPKPAGSEDSVLFRLVLRPQSFARGKITLSGQASHAGTFVTTTEIPIVAETAADGAYELAGLPPGTWTGLAVRQGFQPRIFDIVVPFVGDTVQVSTVTLVPGGPIAKR